MRLRHNSSTKTLQQISPQLFNPELTRPASATALSKEAKFIRGPRAPSADASMRNNETPTNFRLDPFVGTLTLDSYKPIDLSRAGLFRRLSAKAPTRPSFAVKFGKASNKADSFENYLKLNTENRTQAYKLKPPLPIAIGSNLPISTGSLTKLITSARLPLKIEADYGDIAVSGRPATTSLPTSASSRVLRRRAPRPKYPAKITEGVGPVPAHGDRLSNMQDELTHKLKTVCSQKSYDETERPSLISSRSDFDCLSPDEKLYMSPKYSDDERLKASSFRKGGALKLPSQRLRPQSSAQVNKPLTVRFEVKVSRRPQTAGKLVKGCVLASPRSIKQEEIRKLRLN